MTARARTRARRRLVASAVVATALVAGTLVTGSPAQADPAGSGDARAQAAAIARQVDDLQTRTEVATEHYNALTTRLAGVVTESIQASDRLDALTNLSSESQDDATRRISAIYRSGGGLSLYATVLDGSSPSDLMSRLYTVQSIVGDDRSQVSDLEQSVKDAAATKSRMLDLAHQRTELSRQAEDARTRVATLLADKQSALDAANATVTRLVAEEQARAQAAAEEQARAQLVDVGALLGDAPPGNPYAAAAITAATSKLGVPYVWGATGPDTFDCSGLVQWAYRQAGLGLLRVAADQYRSGPPVDLRELAPGDLVFWATDPSNKATIHHVAMYVGNGQMIEAPHSGALVRLVPLRLGPEFAGAVRPGLAAAGGAPTAGATA